MLLVIDEFDVFARGSRQTLLYTLLDLTQSHSAQFGIIGVSARLDVVELLEKRLRSRFSHRRVFLGPPGSEEECMQLVAQGLGLPVLEEDGHGTEGEEEEEEGEGRSKRRRTAATGPGPTVGAGVDWPALADRHNTQVAQALGNR